MVDSLRPFRFGVQVDFAQDRLEWKAKARRAESLGYDILLMPDHFGRQLAIGPALAVVAEATTSLRIGTLIWQNDLRHPAMLAMEAATLDLLSDGRFEMGLGAGGSFLRDYEWTGIPFESPRSRVDRLEESVRIIRGIAGPAPFSFTGRHYTIRDYQGLPRPIQSPIPMLIGGGGRRMLTLAAQQADIVSVFPRMVREGGFATDEGSVEAFRKKTAYVRERAADRVSHLEFYLLVQMVQVTDNRDREIDRLNAERGRIDRSWADSPMVYIGSVEEICDQLRSVREAIGASYFVVFEKAMEDLAPVVQTLARS